MTAQELRAKYSGNSFEDEINTMTIDQIYQRFEEYAQDRRFSAPFYGKIDKDLCKLFESNGYTVRVYGEAGRQQMTEIRW